MLGVIPVNKRGVTSGHGTVRLKTNKLKYTIESFIIRKPDERMARKRSCIRGNDRVRKKWLYTTADYADDEAAILVPQWTSAEPGLQIGTLNTHNVI